MKYVILVCDGAADWNIKEIGNKTIFEAANIPNMDFLAKNGKMGTLKTIPDSMKAGSEVANMTIMGYNPVTDLTGRGPLEALSSGVEMKPTDIAFRCNLITIEDEKIKDYSAGHISTEEAKILIEDLNKGLGEEGVSFHPGVQYRHILKLDGNRFSENIDLTPPHDQLGNYYKDYLIKPLEKSKKAIETSKYLNNLIEKSNEILKNHPINLKRKENGNNIANYVWFWSGGKKPNIKPFKEKYRLNGSVISAVDLIFGIGIAAGLKPIHVKGATGLPDTNYLGKAKAALDSLKNDDYVYLHVEATDEMGHAGDYKRKIKALEDFDEKIVKSIINAEKDFNDQIIICVLPDHPTPCEIRTHSREPIPFVIYNPKNHSKSDESSLSFSEENGINGFFGNIENGEDFMKLLLNQ